MIHIFFKIKKFSKSNTFLKMYIHMNRFLLFLYSYGLVCIFYLFAQIVIFHICGIYMVYDDMSLKSYGYTYHKHKKLFHIL